MFINSAQKIYVKYFCYSITIAFLPCLELSYLVLSCLVFCFVLSCLIYGKFNLVDPLALKEVTDVGHESLIRIYITSLTTQKKVMKVIHEP
jgi:hypothetical protein